MFQHGFKGCKPNSFLVIRCFVWLVDLLLVFLFPQASGHLEAIRYASLQTSPVGMALAYRLLSCARPTTYVREHSFLHSDFFMAISSISCAHKLAQASLSVCASLHSFHLSNSVTEHSLL